MGDHGVKFASGDGTTSFEEADGGIQAALSNGESLTADLVVMPVGVRPIRTAKVPLLAGGARGRRSTQAYATVTDSRPLGRLATW